MSFYKAFSPYLFKLDPERAHSLAEWYLRRIAPLPLMQDILAARYCVVDERLRTQVAGMEFYNPVGLSAGFDKNGTMVKGLSSLGFGFLELGTITQAPQSGNSKPRLFRFVEEQSLQNAMGSNNQGSLEISKRLRKFYPYSIPLGINVGKNKVIAQSDSLKNYENVLLDFVDVGDYFVFNLSSPNTPNLRELQNVNFVQELFTMARSHTSKPLFVKLSPDMEAQKMLKVAEMSIASGASGIIATNTTIDYSLIEGAKDIGGISGLALREKSREFFEILSEAFFGKTTLISVGGINNAQEAYERIKLGASLIQVFSAMIFEGPSLCRSINQGLLECLERDGFAHINEALGKGIGIKKTKKTSSGKTNNKTEKPITQDSKTPAKRGRKPGSQTSKTQDTKSQSNDVVDATKSHRQKSETKMISGADSDKTKSHSPRVKKNTPKVEEVKSLDNKTSDQIQDNQSKVNE
ncbi:quinone-dependent dihydroorotate dehydrogenase [Helicobacter sp. MIT 05-5293]|uniref:quinone-dependent dihydroorotate dehydrogenase n=1 Tax=Helicobacter sp. MIT 05-5293 TaxID=1548149 RepID=UPI00051D6AE4|nr:quinone-dependent dihydroorotate dehydrogenase [Helicobacter sp. MIT 05-5293]